MYMQLVSGAVATVRLMYENRLSALFALALIVSARTLHTRQDEFQCVDSGSFWEGCCIRRAHILFGTHATM
jgi:hypothetical protein